MDQEIQTDILEYENKFNQAPDDIFLNYNKDKTTYQRKKKRDNQALNLDKFISKAGRVMEKLVE